MSKISTKSETIILDNSGIVKCCVHKGYYLELEDAKENLKIIKDAISIYEKNILLEKKIFYTRVDEVLF